MLREDFWAHVAVGTSVECWPWKRCVLSTGYGQLKLGGKRVLAHRVAWQLGNEGHDIPAGLFVCHHCDNPVCCNPSHLFLGSPRDNTADAVRKGRLAFGSANPNAKLDEGQVAEIRMALANGALGVVLAKRYGVTKYTISLIKCGKGWKVRS